MEYSKLMVAVNPNAKANHFNEVKMRLNLVTREKTTLLEERRQKEKKDEAILAKVGTAHSEMQSLCALVHKQYEVKLMEDPFSKQVASIENGVSKMNELIKSCKVLMNKDAGVFTNSTKKVVNQ